MHDNDKAKALLFQQQQQQQKQQQQQQRHIFRTSYIICFIHKTVSLWNGNIYLSMNINRPKRYFLCQMRKWAVAYNASTGSCLLRDRFSEDTLYLV